MSQRTPQYGYVTGRLMLNNDTRKYIRHPSSIPLRYALTNKPRHRAKATNNISFGGLSFKVQEELPTNSWLTITIDLYNNNFKVEAQVCWCRAQNDASYDVGVNFSDNLDAFSIRMIEQICYIECYRKKVLDDEGRKLSSDEAAKEWITKFATEFP